MNCPQCCKPLKKVIGSSSGKVEWLCEDCALFWDIKKVGLLANAKQEIIDRFLQGVKNES